MLMMQRDVAVVLSCLLPVASAFIVPATMPALSRGLPAVHSHNQAWSARQAPLRPARAVRHAFSPVVMQAVVPQKLSELPLRDYIDKDGNVGYDKSEGLVGVYAIYDKSETLRFVGQSRYLDNSLRVHLGRMPSECYYFKVQTVTKPSRTILEEIKKEWYAEAGAPTDNDGGSKQERWENALDVTKHVELSEIEKKELTQMTSDNTISTLRNLCRRVQKDFEDVLAARGLKEKINFAPKLKEQGLLDVSSVKVAGVDTIGGDTKLDASLVQDDPKKRIPKSAAVPK